MNARLPAACAACDEHLVSLAFDEPASVPAECVAHASSCLRCAAELQALRDTRELAALPLEEPSDALDARILAALDAHLAETQTVPSRPPLLTVMPGGAPPQASAPRPLPRRGWRAPMAAAASLAVLIGGVLMMSEGIRLARQGVPETAQSKAGPALVQAQKEEAPAPPPAPVVPAERIEHLTADLQKSAPPATGGQAAPPARTSGARKEAANSKTRAKRDEGSAPPAPYAAKEYEPAPKAKSAPTEAKKGAPVLEKYEAPTATSAEQEPPPPARELAIAKQNLAEADRRVVLEDLDTGRFAASAPPATPSALGGTSTRSMPSARNEARAVVDHDRLLSQADASAVRGDHLQAAGLYARVAHDEGAPAKLVIRALEGQAKSLLALGRFDEAAAAARRLSAMAPGSTRLSAEIESARRRAADADSK